MSNPYATMLDTAQARIAALEAERAALCAKLRALCDAAATITGATAWSESAWEDLKAAVAATREVLNG